MFEVSLLDWHFQNLDFSQAPDLMPAILSNACAFQFYIVKIFAADLIIS